MVLLEQLESAKRLFVSLATAGHAEGTSDLRIISAFRGGREMSCRKIMLFNSSCRSVRLRSFAGVGLRLEEKVSGIRVYLDEV